jgi:hypothetical protein
MGTVVEFGSELRGFQQFEDYVTVQIVRRFNGEESVEETQVPWLVGTDGAHSIVRKTLGLSFLGETREENELVIGDLQVTAGLEHKYWERWVSSSNLVMMRPSGQDKDVFIIFIGGPDVDCNKVSTNREELIKSFYSITKRTDVLFGDFNWVSKYRPNIRMVDTVRVGRVFIAGDAAHCHTPAGGQGMNSSIQDSFNLGWKLSLVYKGYASAALLDTYQEERLPIIAQMLDKTTALFNGVVENRGDVTQARRDPDITQLGVCYRGSSIIGEDDIGHTTLKVSGYNKDSETAACPGDRAPEVPSLINTTGEHKHESLFGIFSPSHHSVLAFASKYEEDSALALSTVINRLPGKTTIRTVLILPAESNVNQVGTVYDQVLIDSKNHAYASYGLPSGQSYFVVVRPDGIIGARVHEVAGVERYFQKIFS